MRLNRKLDVLDIISVSIAAVCMFILTSGILLLIGVVKPNLAVADNVPYVEVEEESTGGE